MSERDQDLDLLKSIRLCAYGSVRDRDPDYILRHIFRWYSKTFCTRLQDVDDLPLEFVLTQYFEEKYENMDESERDEEEALLRETYAERIAREREEEARKATGAADDDEFFRQAQERARAAEAKRLAAAAAAGLSLPKPAQKPFQGLVPAPPARELPKPQDPTPAPIPEDVTITFVDEDELGDLDDWSVVGPPPKRK